MAAAIVAAVCVFTLRAEVVSLDDAKDAVRGWLALRNCAGGVAGGRTLRSENGAPFHVVRIGGGGFVVTASDTDDEPVTAFSTGDDLDEDPRNPLFALLMAHSRARGSATNATTSASRRRAASGPSRRRARKSAAEKWRTLRDAAGRRGRATAAAKPPTGIDSIDDVRVAPLVHSKWDQLGLGGKPNTATCFNYYTPNNWPCGCVATAGAQLMRFFEFPAADASFAPTTVVDCAVGGASNALTTFGGSFDWSDMPLVPPMNATETQRQAIGHLCYDMGVLCGMWYDSNESAALTDWIARALRHYGYSAVAAYADVGCTDSDLLQAAVSNLDAGLPVAFRIAANNGAHAVVVDGYGYSEGAQYLHLNMGWSGGQDAWYAPPDFENAYYVFDVFDCAVYNIYTNAAVAGNSICSGRVLAQDGETPVAGAVVTARGANAQKSMRTNEKGIYAFILPPGEYALEAAHGLRRASAMATLVQCESSETDADGWYLSGLDNPVVGNLCDQDLILDAGKGFLITVQ